MFVVGVLWEWWAGRVVGAGGGHGWPVGGWVGWSVVWCGGEGGWAHITGPEGVGA